MEERDALLVPHASAVEALHGIEVDYTMVRPKGRSMLRPYEIIWVVGVISLIVFLHVTAQCFIMWPYYQHTRSFTFAQYLGATIPHHCLACYLYLTYYVCLNADAGGVPNGWAPVLVSQHDETKAPSEHRRYCHKCDAFKPPRSHHCRVCRRCVLRMDHHCPWIGNCVGHGTYAPFLRFVTAVCLTVSYHLGMLILRVTDYWNEDGYFIRPSNTVVVLLVLNLLFAIPVFGMVGFLTLYHYYLLAVNMTSIESWETDRVSRQIRRGQIPYAAFPFDVGVWRNIASILGHNVVWWAWPWQRPPKDGLSYAVSLKDPDAQYFWPPRDPRARPTKGFSDASDEDALYDSGSSDDEIDAPEERMLQHASVRVRRGSEGLEVRAPQYNQQFWDEYLNAAPPTTASRWAALASAPADPVYTHEDDVPLATLVRRKRSGMLEDE